MKIKFDPYLTVYRKDYIAKPIKRTTSAQVEQEFSDPLREGFKKYLILKPEKSGVADPQQAADDYLEKFKKIYEKLGETYYKTPLDKDVIERSFLFDGRTVYQADYCDLAKDLEYAQRLRRGSVLPDDWDVPLTTQRSSYKNPVLLNKKALHIVSPIKSPNNLDPCEETRKIMNVQTGYTEYQGVIGSFGKVIIEDELHGKVSHPPCKKERKK